MNQLRIRGLAGRAEHFGPDVEVPPNLPLLCEFSPLHEVGTAALARDEEGIRVHAAIRLDGYMGAVHEERGAPGISRLYPYLGLAVMKPVITDDDGNETVTAGQVVMTDG